MQFKQTTQVPNFIFDTYLPLLTESELKTLLIIIRQTSGWKDRYTGERKTRDRISHAQFCVKTGLSKRIVSKTIQTLLSKELIRITDYRGFELKQASARKGKTHLYYGIAEPVHNMASTSAHEQPKPVHKGVYNKTNYTKLNRTKGALFQGQIHSLVSARHNAVQQACKRCF